MKKVLRNIVDFFPYIVVFYMVFFGNFFGSLAVKNQPGIVALGLFTLPTVICLIIAIIRTYKELPETGKLPGFVDKDGTETPRFNLKFGILSFGFIILVIIFSTYLYYGFPETLKVPSNSDPSLWQNPSFENTILYEQMTPEERESLLANGVPNSNSMFSLIFMDIMAIGIAALCFAHAYKNFGFWMATCFFVGSYIYTGQGESGLILFGRFVFGGQTNNMLGEAFHGTFWYPRAAVWFIHCPILICTGWYYLAYSCVWVAGKVFPRINLYARAAVGGFLALLIDIWEDPVMTSPEFMMWVWGKGDPIELFGIPVWNFWGWFMVITIFAVLWEKLPNFKAKWGLAKGSVYFYITCFICTWVALFLIYLYNIIIGGILALAGVQHALQIPPGW